MIDAKGFSLVETLVSVAIFAVVAAAVGSLMATSFLAEGWAANHAVAVTLAQQQLENLRSLKRQRGFTFVELLVGLSITGIMGLTMVALFVATSLATDVRL